jgi:haloalkane dehalogenase
MNAPAWRALYPFASHALRIDGHKYHYVAEGQGDALIFVHGNPTWSFYWRNLIVGLRDHYRCLAVDHVGCGLSDKPEDYPYTLEKHIDNLRRFIDRLDIVSATLVMHDWGGAIGLGAALKVSDRIDRLVLFNTGAFPPPFVPLRIRLCRMPLLGTFAVRQLNVFARAATWMAVEKRDRMTPEVKGGLLAPYDNWAHRVAIDCFVRDIPFTRRHKTWPVLEQIEQGLTTLADRPVQMIWGMKDWCFRPNCLERLLTHFPTAEVHRLADAGHYVVEDAHERILPLMRNFLEKT